ncbi:MAG: rRNA maturation RNase YbeY [Ardenticatenaceae bacterium]|nr:rRNA maturation RNase YbeY [Anaerolineales bacterium]MCB8921928.1 rRNA maturation RNase YbeY [Ardenticatenaceae bacterium]MCB8989503.1 rRNA maturation RNase YbeY [Ardenticatenaceae bacterium]MCB9003047.1 rRNA maturation RNase YbeY [Ardenticatenaceae bacterium]
MADIEVDFEREVDVPEEVLGLLETAVTATLRHQNQLQGMITCLLTDDTAVQELNRSFRHEDKPTDVLSFPAGETMPGMEAVYLGDIAISVPYAERQAAQAGHALVEELQLLVIHGVLHLLGHDHGTPAEKEAMWAAQTAVLTQLGLSHVTPTES